MEMPISKVYEQELIYMPYKDSLGKVLAIICSATPKNSSLLDLMCGPGYLLGKINQRRKDIHLHGVDLDEKYIEHAKRKYPKIKFEVGDVLNWNPKQDYDAVICTGALHHLPYERQEELIEKIASITKPEGLAIISDCYIDDYSNEQERKIAAAKLGYEYLKATVENGAPDEVVSATADILKNDVMKEEFKTSLGKRELFFEKHFSKFHTQKVWPQGFTEYGDYITLLLK